LVPVKGRWAVKLFGWDGELQAWQRVLVAATRGALVYMTHVIAGCLLVELEISTGPYRTP